MPLSKRKVSILKERSKASKKIENERANDSEEITADIAEMQGAQSVEVPNEQSIFVDTSAGDEREGQLGDLELGKAAKTQQIVIERNSEDGRQIEIVDIMVHEATQPATQKQQYSSRNKRPRRLPDSGDYTCHICEKVCVNRTKYLDHIRYHTAERVKCDYCERKFTRNAPLKRHKLLVHTDVMTPEEVESLQVQIETDLTCKVCCRVFRARSSLQYHQQLHKGELKFTCSSCGYQCLTRSALRQHEMTHDSTCVRCLNCHRLYKDMEDWKIHTERMHPDEEARSTMNAAAFTERTTTLRKTRCLDEEGNIRIRLGEDDAPVQAPENVSENEVARSQNGSITKSRCPQKVNLDTSMDAVDTELRDFAQYENNCDEAKSEENPGKKFTMFQCVPCGVVFFGKDGLVDHFLQDHEDMTRAVDIFFTNPDDVPIMETY